MLLGILTIIAVSLTVAMFATRNLMLGFPSAIFWAILGGHCYQESAATWDIYYLIFFASMGMAIFCMYSMYALRPSDLSEPDADKGKYFDEVEEPDLRGNIDKSEGKYADEQRGAFFDETKSPKPSDRIKRLRDRATKRRTS